MDSPIIYVIDAGNTHIKLAEFIHHELSMVHRFSSLHDLQAQLPVDAKVVLANVGNPEITLGLKELGCRITMLSKNDKLPFINAYLTPDTLGIDRLCNIAAVHHLHPNKNVLVLDAGTCIKSDFIDCKGTYHGGSISPGIRLRYQSLHEHTAALPILHPGAYSSLGSNTEDSIHSGVMGSIKAELLWRIDEFNNRCEDLHIYLTGGDSHYFDLGQKNGIFVDENLTLKGIYALHRYQHS
jgi:type III pantothenate kinase